MIRIALLALVCALLASPAEARHRQHAAYTIAHPDCNILWPCEGVVSSPRGLRIEKTMPFGTAQKVYKHREAWVQTVRVPRHTIAHVVPDVVHAVVSTVSGIVAPLAAKVAEIQGACGSKVISAIRHTYIAGTHRISLHASGQAVDMAGNPSCIYSHLQGYAGGYSTDYARMAHVHISWGGPEHGIRFVHGGGHRHHYAHGHHHGHYASR